MRRRSPPQAPRRAIRAILCAALLVGALAGDATAGSLTDSEFRKAASAAGKLMKQSGEAVEKKGVLATLAREDSTRTLEVLVQWAAASSRLRAKRLEPAVAKCAAEYEKYRAKVLKKHKGSPAGWSDAERSRVAKRRAALKEARALVVTEANLMSQIGEVFARTQDQDGITYLVKTGLPSLMKLEGAEGALDGGLRLLLTQPPSVAGDGVVNAVVRPLTPQTRIRALDWIALELLDGAAVRITPCLKASSVPVRRAALRTIATLDDPLVVPAVIEALETSDGLLASELEAVLHNFTGQSFSSDGSAWGRWWKENGPAWLEAEDGKRHGKQARLGDMSFYGIPTPSKRIVFLLDRSGSMEHPAQKKVEGAAPVTGGKGEGPEIAAGQSKLQVAKAELRRAINRLGVDAKFNVLFYNHKVKAWKAPPALLPASRENKAAARAWFDSQKPVGSTELFAGLMRALDYGNDLKKDAKPGAEGVDTIFLLSDGAPTTGFPARLLTEEEIEAAVTKFLAANELHRCVVHTIGVGPLHNKPLMKRLAAETGGEYVAVGMDPPAEENGKK